MNAPDPDLAEKLDEIGSSPQLVFRFSCVSFDSMDAFLPLHLVKKRDMLKLETVHIPLLHKTKTIVLSGGSAFSLGVAGWHAICRTRLAGSSISLLGPE